MKLATNLKQFIKDHQNDDVNSLALKTELYPDIDLNFAIQQIKGKQIARIKIPSWYHIDDIIYPKHLSLEQCSSEYTARYKAEIYSSDSIVDLTGGFGVDCAFLSKSFNSITYVEQQQDLVEIARHNFEALRLKINTICQNAVDYLNNMEFADLIYIDPARRGSSGSKMVFIEDCTPNIIDIQNLIETKSKKTMIKLSPMLDISLALKSLRNVSDVYIISYQNECKELVFLKNNEEKVDNTNIHCINISNAKLDEFVFQKEEENDTEIYYTDQICKYLYEPNCSIIKAGAFKSISNKYSIYKLHPNSHLYTSDNLIDNFQGRIFQVENISTLNKKEIKTHLKYIKQANISTRNFPISPLELRKRIGLKDGGNNYIFGTTLANEKKVLLICKKI